MKTIHLDSFGVDAIINQIDLRKDSAQYALDYTKLITQQMLEQILDGVGRNAIWSWGTSQLVGLCYEALNSDGEQRALIPVLRFHVAGLLLPDGHVHVIYNEGNDTYIVVTTGKDGEVIHQSDDVYCDQLGEVIDGFVERDPSWTDDEYLQRANAATVAQGMPPLVSNGKPVVVEDLAYHTLDK